MVNFVRIDREVEEEEEEDVSLATLSSLAQNKENLEALGGVDNLARMLNTNLETGLTIFQVDRYRSKYGENTFPEKPLDSYLGLLFDALGDPVLRILMVAAAISIAVETYQHPEHGWIDGTAIFIAVALVSNLSTYNDYNKQLQFRALEKSSAEDEQTSVVRDGVIVLVNPAELVVGDIVLLGEGNVIPADCVICDRSHLLSNESSLTGESDDVKKSKATDPFLLSACLITECEQTHAMVIGIGAFSQWGKIRAGLVNESPPTPLQTKLEAITLQVGKIGVAAALLTFIAKMVWVFSPMGTTAEVTKGVIDAFILAVAIVVVAIPEGLPLAVTISLAYSTKRMLEDKCLIRVLAACETMGNATTICTDKTGTLTQNLMTVVEGWFADVIIDQDEIALLATSRALPLSTQQALVEHISVNRTAYLMETDPQSGVKLVRPLVIGNKTEGALLGLIGTWGFSYEATKKGCFDESRDRVYAFNSGKKRSTAVVHQKNGSVMLYCKGASEWILRDCSQYTDATGKAMPLTPKKRDELARHIESMADRALRTLCLAHKSYEDPAQLPPDWQTSPPDGSDLVLDCIVGIIDPLRPDVKEAVRVAQKAGIVVRMVTGDNISTACAIAKQCGILKEGGVALEGAAFRALTPAELDRLLPQLQVLARASPDDKYLLVTRLNGHGIPSSQEEWEERMKGKEGVTFEKHRDLLLPGFRDEWIAARPGGGEVVGVTGDGTNDAPALKAADVGLAMGSGTKVAQSASDIVILDDKFSSIVKAISWGRCVYDSVRKFVQFQLTVNLVALLVVFIGACCNFANPLTTIELLFVNLVMDTLGALALSTEPPGPELLDRKPYKRSSSLISRPMRRNILVHASVLLTLALIILFSGPQLFDVPQGTTCGQYDFTSSSTTWDAASGNQVENGSLPGIVTCASFRQDCDESPYGIFAGDQQTCFEENRSFKTNDGSTVVKSFADFSNFEQECLGGGGLDGCAVYNNVHSTLIYNTFVFYTLFNEFNSRELGNRCNIFRGLATSHIFQGVIFLSIVLQLVLVYFGGSAVGTSPLTLGEFLVTVALGAVALPVGVVVRLLPIGEDLATFFVAPISSLSSSI